MLKIFMHKSTISNEEDWEALRPGDPQKFLFGLALEVLELRQLSY